MARGNIEAVTAATATAWTTVYDASTDGKANTFGIEGKSENTDRINVRWTGAQGRLNYLSVGPGAYKQFGSADNSVSKVEIQSVTADQQAYVDLIAMYEY